MSGQEMDVVIVSIDDKGRLVIPKRIRRKAGISENRQVFVYALNELVFIRKADVKKPPIGVLRRQNE